MSSTDDSNEAAVCERWLPAARIFARRRLGGAGDDVAQEAMLVGLRALRAGEVSVDEMGAYLLGVCRNLARAQQRRDARRDALLQRWVPPRMSGAEAIPIDRARLLGCLSRLTARARDVVIRTFVNDEDGPEIAAALGMTNTNVRVTRLRALVMLHACMNRGPDS